MQDAILKSEYKIKKAYPAEHIINWYLSNYIDSQNNGIRDDSFDVDKEDWKPIWFDDIEMVRKEFKGRLVTHSDFIRLMKHKGIHNKYYHYKKYENDCEICKALGMK